MLGMLGSGGVVVVFLLATGSSFGSAWPFAILLACPLMMGGMMFMMMRGGNGQKQGNDTTNAPDRNDATDKGNHAAPETWQDSPNITSPQATTRP